MERESFESTEVAEILNSHFIPIKIDREERPDIDAIYMNYVQATTGSGGWPLNVFLTPELEPVFGGTYWPGPNNSMSAVGTAIEETVGFLDILKKMKTVWTQQEDRCRESAKEITKQLREFAQEGVHGHGEQNGEKTEGDGLEVELLEEAYRHFERRYDKYNGGFSSAPKFPTPANLSFLLRLGLWPEIVRDVVGEEECANAKDMAITTLRKMARGGVRDQVGYGFARYSVTKDWSLPHFEKMLYDQAQLLDVYLDAFLITHDPEMLGAIYDIVIYLTSPPITGPNGGLFSAEDADSHPTKADAEKREGAYYVWTSKELQNILGPRDADIFSRFYGVKPDGNVAHQHDPHDELINQNVLHIVTTPSQLSKDLSFPEPTITSSLKSSRQKLREYRDANRPRPALDDKIVTCWNGLAISALSRSASALQSMDPSFSSKCLQSALSTASFIRSSLYDEKTKTLYRIYSSGTRGSTLGLCDDYAFLIQGLLDLYEATYDESHLAFADELQRIQLDRFRDPEHPAGFYTTPSPHPQDLLLRLKSGMDSAEPSSNNVSTRNLYRLGSMFEDEGYSAAARGTVEAFEAEILQFPFCFAGLLGSVVLGHLGVKGVVVMGGGGKNDDIADIPQESSKPTSTATTDASTGGSGSGSGSSTSISTSLPQSTDSTTATTTTAPTHPPRTESDPDSDPQTQTQPPPSTPASILSTLRATLSPIHTVVLLHPQPQSHSKDEQKDKDKGADKSQWLRTRNPLLKTVNLDGSKAGTVMVCEKGVCREGGVEILL